MSRFDWSSNYLERPRLFDRLTTLVEGGTQLVLVEAPLGYGKTVCVRQWAQTRSVYWVSMRGVTDAGSALARTVGLTPASFLELQAWAQGLTTPTVVVIDDYHRVTSFDQDEAVVDLLKNAPNLRLVILGRRSTLFNSPLTTARITVGRLGPVELAFTSEEYGKWRMGDGEAYRGWPLGIRANHIARHAGLSHSEAAAQIADELVTFTTESEYRLLVALARFPGLPTSVAARALEHSQSQVEADLATLKDLGFVTGDDLVLPALQDYLAQAGMPSDQIDSGLREEMAQYWEESSPARSMRLWMEAGQMQAANDLVMRNFIAVINAGNDSLQPLRSVSPMALNNYPALLMARLVLERRDSGSPVTLVESIAKQLQASARRALVGGDPLETVMLEGFLIVTERLGGGWDEALSLSKDLMRRSYDPLLSAYRSVNPGAPELYSVVSQTACLVGDFNLAQQAASARLELSQHQENRLEEVRSWGVLALISALRGRSEEALVYLDRADQVKALYRVNEGSWAYPNAQIARAIASSVEGSFADAEAQLQWLSPRADQVEQWPLIVFAEAIYYATQQNAHEAFLAIRHRLQTRPENRKVSPFWIKRLLEFAANCALSFGNQALTKNLHERAKEIEVPNFFDLIDLRLSLIEGPLEPLIGRIGDTLGSESPSLNRDRLLAIGALAAARLGREDQAQEWSEELMRATNGAASVDWALAAVPYEWLLDFAQTEAGSVLRPRIEGLSPRYRMPLYEPLSPSEKAVLEMLAQGSSIQEIAERLVLSSNTVKFHLRNLYPKLKVTSRDDAVNIARKIGLINSGS